MSDCRLPGMFDYFRFARHPGSSKDPMSGGVRAIYSLSKIGGTLCAGQQCVEFVRCTRAGLAGKE